MEMEEEYGIMDDQITHYMNRRPVFHATPQPPRDPHYAMVMLGGGDGGGGVSFGSDLTTGMLSTTSGFSGDSGSGSACGNGLYMDQIAGRWSKEETLALLDIRSRLDSQFKEANQKGHLWEEVSRIMYVDHGYKRSGKTCSVKFENLNKYYKKIKDGKTGKNGWQDTKHYRFFHQLEALYGESSNMNSTNLSPNYTFSVTNATLAPFMEKNDRNEKTFNKIIRRKKRWKTVITEYIETKMNTLMEKQEEWMQKVMITLEEKENERILKEVQRRKEEAARLDMEKKFRSNEIAWLQSRDLSLMEALKKFTKNESIIETSRFEYRNDQNQVDTDWDENEITQLIQLRSCMETRFEECGFMENVLWEEIALSMAGLGYNRSALMCKAKWDSINFLLRNKKQIGWSNNGYYDHHNHIFHQAGERSVSLNAQLNDCGNKVLMGDHEMMWNYNGNR